MKSFAALLPVLAVAAQTLRAEDVLHRSYASILADPQLSIRQSDGSEANNDTATLNPDGSLNMTSFTLATDVACTSMLASMARAGNPSGMSICFNLPSLDTTSGAFEADLRLYKVSEPRGAWENVKVEDFDVNVGFNNARVQNVTEEEVRGVGMVGELGKRQNQGDGPQLMQKYMLVGQISSSSMQPNMSMAALEALIMPSLSLTVDDPKLNTTLSPNEASFLTGVFSDQTPMSDFSAAQAAVSESLDRLAAEEEAFVLPGTQIMIFPIGAVVTGTWVVLGVGVYGWGTVGRWRFREGYKERVKMGMAATSRMGI